MSTCKPNKKAKAWPSSLPPPFALDERIADINDLPESVKSQLKTKSMYQCIYSILLTFDRSVSTDEILVELYRRYKLEISRPYLSTCLSQMIRHPRRKIGCEIERDPIRCGYYFVKKPSVNRKD